MKRSLALLAVLLTATRAAPQTKLVPDLQAVPQPYHQLSFQRDAQEITRLFFDPQLRRPFLFPIIGPSGRRLTRMGHPHDPEGHSHHNSVWISHHDVNGVTFWGDKGPGRIVHQRIEKIADDGKASWVITHHAWIDESKKKTLLLERRRTHVQILDNPGEWLLILDVTLQAKEDVVLGKTPFGPIGVRMAKTIGVHDGGGTIRNSSGQTNEKGVFWKRAKWVDYAGPVVDKTIEGITLFDHPDNPNHPSVFHVRDDGWMGASLTFEGPLKIAPSEPLHVRYGLYIHRGLPAHSELDRRWREFADIKLVEPARKK
ncbi:MAG: PmoA family protein [Gemmataceae bacterium]|nr:PmoA family protein [Gemmataceae bacterium]